MTPGAHQGAQGPLVLKPGDVLLIDEAASVQFAGANRLTLRLTRVHDRETYQGWVWLSGYVLNQRGNATQKREIFVQVAGLKRADLPVPATLPVSDRARARGGR